MERARTAVVSSSGRSSGKFGALARDRSPVSLRRRIAWANHRSALPSPRRSCSSPGGSDDDASEHFRIAQAKRNRGDSPAAPSAAVPEHYTREGWGPLS
jgi:hypothetical protein